MSASSEAKTVAQAERLGFVVSRVLERLKGYLDGRRLAYDTGSLMAEPTRAEIVDRFVADHQFERTDGDVFVARTGPSTQRLYGGAILSRAVLAAALTVADKRVHSFHAFFLSPGEPEAVARVQVIRTRDGRAFANRHASVFMGERKLCELTASFTAAGEDQPIALVATEPDAPDPASCPDGWDLLQDHPDVWMPPRGALLETRYADLPWVHSGQPDAPWRIWVRPVAPLPDDANCHLAASIYMSDMRSNGTVERVFGLPLGPANVVSLDHSIWFHRAPNLSDWSLVTTECTAAIAGRAFMNRRMYTRDGHLFATVAQEMAYRDIPEAAG